MVPVYVKGGAWSNVEGECDCDCDCGCGCFLRLCFQVLTTDPRPDPQGSDIEVWAAPVGPCGVAAGKEDCQAGQSTLA